MTEHKLYGWQNAALLAALIGWSGLAQAAFIGFSGQLVAVTGPGGGRYSGAMPGDMFSGGRSRGPA